MNLAYFLPVLITERQTNNYTLNVDICNDKHNSILSFQFLLLKF
jgi:hypothetical protein